MINKLENKEGIIIIKNYDTAVEILKDTNFIVPNLVDFLDRLMKATGRNLSMLRLFINSSPFFLEGEKHAYLRKISSDFLGVKNYEQWVDFFQVQINNILINLENQKEFDLVKVGETIFTHFLKPYLGIYPNNVKEFDKKAMVLQKLIEPMLSINKLEKVNNDLCDLINNLNLNKLSEESLNSVFNQLLNDEYNLNLDEKKAYIIFLYAATAPLAQTIVNILVNLYEQKRTVSSEEFLNQVDYYIWKSAAPIYIHRIALKDRKIHNLNIKKGNTVLIEIASSFKQDKKEFNTLPQTKSLPFGMGKHFCLGAFISKSLICELVPKFIEKYPNLDVVSKQKDNTNHIAHAYTSAIVKKVI